MEIGSRDRFVLVATLGVFAACGGEVAGTRDASRAADATNEAVGDTDLTADVDPSSDIDGDFALDDVAESDQGPLEVDAIDPPADASSMPSFPALPSDPAPELASGCGACGTPRGGRIGGGAGYPFAVSATRATVTVSTVGQLVSALAAAHAGDVVYVSNTATLDLTGMRSIAIPAGVTLASGRGVAGSPGGMILTSNYDTLPLFIVRGDNVRITGIRLRGPDPDVHSGAYVLPNSQGLQFRGRNAEVDNCELSGWSHAAIAFYNTSGGYVHHNSIHHNRRSGLGYGVVLVGSSSALVEANAFDACRHGIAGDGQRDQSYEARYNTYGTSSVGHAFDMHGEAETHSALATSPYAGDAIRIHHNTFQLTSYPAVRVRGRPFTGAWIDHNSFAQSTLGDAVQQLYFTGNFHVASNCLARTTPSCTAPGHWLVSDAGRTSWATFGTSDRSVRSVAFGDFDGDGRDDAFYADGVEWTIAYPASAAPRRARFSRIPMQDLAVGDFDGDGRADVFYASGSGWYLSRGGTEPFERMASSTTRRAQLAFGDFDGDGRADVFFADGTNWNVSYGGRMSFTVLANSGTALADLAFGDFDGDHRTDVFYADGTAWFVSSGGNSSFRRYASSSTRIGDLLFGDFDGDGRADVFQGTGALWHISSGGNSSWATINSSSAPTSALAAADVTGDGRVDVLGNGP